MPKEYKQYIINITNNSKVNFYNGRLSKSLEKLINSEEICFDSNSFTFTLPLLSSIKTNKLYRDSNGVRFSFQYLGVENIKGNYLVELENDIFTLNKVEQIK